MEDNQIGHYHGLLAARLYAAYEARRGEDSHEGGRREGSPLGPAPM